MQSASSANRLVGLALIVLGVLLLLPLVTDFDFSLSTWWPLFLLAFGAYLLSQGLPWQALTASGVAAVFLLNNLNVLNFNVWALWPVALIVIGASILFGHSRSRAEAGAAPAPGDDLAVSCLFSGNNQRIDSQQFTGGSVSATFGGAEIDLRGAALAGGAATINVNAVFGGVEIHVPPEWRVDVRVSAMFGGVEKKRAEPADPKAILTITGSCLFGGIEITS